MSSTDRSFCSCFLTVDESRIAVILSANVNTEARGSIVDATAPEILAHKSISKVSVLLSPSSRPVLSALPFKYCHTASAIFPFCTFPDRVVGKLFQPSLSSVMNACGLSVGPSSFKLWSWTSCKISSCLVEPSAESLRTATGISPATSS